MRQAEFRHQTKGRAFDHWAWATAYVPSSTPLPALTLAEATSRPARQRRATPLVAVESPLSHQLLYLALRITGEDETSAADGAKVSTSVAARLETIYHAGQATGIRSRHQANDSATARRSEVKYLRQADGRALASSLAQAAPHTLQQFSMALTPMRDASYLLPAVTAFRQTLIRFTACLPPTLAVLTQFKKGRLQSDERARLHDAKLRIYVGDDDRDLGQRPRIFVVDALDPMNFVQRARRTANTRALLAALQLIGNTSGSNSK